MTNFLIIAWFYLGFTVCGPLAYHVRVCAGQGKKHAFFQALVTALMPVLLFQDLEHARLWEKLFPGDKFKKL